MVYCLIQTCISNYILSERYSGKDKKLQKQKQETKKIEQKNWRKDGKYKE